MIANILRRPRRRFAPWFCSCVAKLRLRCAPLRVTREIVNCVQSRRGSFKAVRQRPPIRIRSFLKRTIHESPLRSNKGCSPHVLRFLCTREYGNSLVDPNACGVALLMVGFGRACEPAQGDTPKILPPCVKRKGGLRSEQRNSKKSEPPSVRKLRFFFSLP